MTDKFQKELINEFNSLKEKIEKPNILLIGGTGVGKSSLLNLCFGEDLAKTGIGKPVTQHIDKFSSKNVPIVLFDSKGYEIGAKQEEIFQREVLTLCSSGSSKIENKPHLAWYCIQSISSRITDFDITMIQKIREANVPISVVLTKSDLVSDQDALQLKNAIKNVFNDIHIFETTIKDISDGMELKELVKWSTTQLPKALRTAFISAQKASLQEKRDCAKNVINQHTTLAFATGFIPIPASSAPILLANQSKLLARILYIYNLDAALNNVSSIIQTALKLSLPTAGKYAASQILKLIPVVGTLLGGSINGAVAASITSAFGFAVSESCAKVTELGINNFNNSVFDDNFNKDLINMFIDNLKQEQKVNHA